MKRKLLKAWLSTALVVAFMLQMFPITALEQNAPVNETGIAEENNLAEEISDEYTPPLIIAEEESKRTATVKHFRCTDGSYIRADYSIPVHFQDENGAWQEYDNRVAIDDPTVSEEAQEYATLKSDRTVRFAKKAKASNMLSLTGEYGKISWGYASANNSTVVVTEKNETVTGNDRFLKLSKLSQEAWYRNLYAHVDLQIIVSSTGIKENLLLNTASARRQFTIEYKTDGLLPVQIDERTVALRNTAGETLYTLCAPLMTDANGESSTALSLQLTAVQNKKFTLVLSADNAWLNAPERAYPVTVDPTIALERDYSNIFDATGSLQNLSSTQKTALLGEMAYLQVGYWGANPASQTTNPELVGLIYTDISDLRDNQIINAQLRFRYYGSYNTANFQINAHQITSSWNKSQNTIGKNYGILAPNISGYEIPQWDSTVLDYVKESIPNSPYGDHGPFARFDITKAVRAWNTGTATNHGILLRASNYTQGRITYLDSDHNNTNNQNLYDPTYDPTFLITYRDTSGLEGYWTTHQQSVGINAVSHINDYNGNLVVTETLMSDSGSRMPTAIQLSYNGCKYNSVTKNSYLGIGFQFDFNQRIDMITGSTQQGTALLAAGYKYIYTDTDGTEHYFRKESDSSSRYIDEDGLGLTITGTGDLTMRDKSDNVWTFSDPTASGGGMLKTIQDSDGNIRTYNSTGTGTSRRITSIVDGAGRTTTITYAYVTNSSTGQSVYHPTEITRPDGKKITLSYTDSNKNLLNHITYPDGSDTEYWYNAGNRLARIYSSNGTRVEYTYNGNRVTSVTEYSSTYGTAAGNKLSITYNANNTTTFVSSNVPSGRSSTEIYQFDDFGQTTSVWHDDGSITNGDYIHSPPTTTAAHTNARQHNKLSASSSTQKYVKNYHTDPNLENVNNTYATTWSGAEVVTSYDDTTSYLGQRSIKVNRTQAGTGGRATQIFTTELAGGPVTLSAYIKTDNVSSSTLGACLYLLYYDADGNHMGDIVPTYGLTGTNDWQRYSLSGTLPAGVAEVRCYLFLMNATGTAWFDCVQLEKNSTASECNLLGNSDFSKNTHWTWPSDAGIVKGTSYMTMPGTAGGNPCVYQTVAVNKANVCFTFFGTAQANSVALIDSRKFAIEVHFRYADGTNEWQHKQFNSCTTARQSISATFRPKKSTAVSTAGFYFLYRYNADTCTLYNAMVTIDQTGTTYTYDANGNLQSAVDNAARNQTYNYTSVSELSSAVNAKNETYTYTYDNTYKHRVTSARSNQKGNGVTLSYDSYGNVVSTKTGTINQAGTLDPTKPYIAGSAAYCAGGNYVQSVTDAREKTTSYAVNTTTGLVNSVTAPATILQDGGHYDTTATTNYTYDANNYNLLSVSGTSQFGTTTNSYAYDNLKQQLTSITHNGFSYNFAYDAWGRRTTTQIGTRVLATNQYLYSASSAPLYTLTYGNGDYLRYGYDKYDRVTSKSSENGTLANYTYNNRGQLARVQDVAAGVTYEYDYDLLGRMVGSRQSGNRQERALYTYDATNNLTRQSIKVSSGGTLNNYYYYGQDNLLTRQTQGAVTFDYTYDTLNRLSTKVIGNVNSSNTVQASYSYLAGANGSTTGLVSGVCYTLGGSSIVMNVGYTYDNAGYIKSMQNSYMMASPRSVTYYYDALGQLVKDVVANGDTTEYAYDAGGNIQSVTKNGTVVKSYGYNDSEWKDLLTGYNGQTITYDQIGNPLNYRDGMAMTWQNGRQLATLQKGTDAVSYTYDADGLRTSKTVNGQTTQYFWDDRGVMYKQANTGGNFLWFYADPDGTIGSINYNDARYALLKNAQGDVIGLSDSSGSIVALYSYDSWGNIISITDGSGNDVSNNPNHIANINPIRYRGYYYDAETGFYYLRSRYYDPVVGRWINADDAIAGVGGDIRGYNLFSYCMNDPVNMSDHTGHWPQWIKNATSAVVSAVKKAVTVVVNTVKSAVSSASNIVKASSDSLPKEGEPGSSQTLPNPDGTPKQKRWYGPDGNPERDRDYNHPGNMPFPHDHEWKNGERGKDHLPPDPSYKMNWEPVIGVGLVVICTVGIIAVAADDVTGVGVADDFLFGPLGAGVGEGLIMVFG